MAIALPQVWINRRWFIDKNYKIYINPAYEDYSLEFIHSREWCLSSHDSKMYEVLRQDSILAKWIDKFWNEREEIFYWLDAIVFQHECDHLDWVIIFDNIV